MGVSPPRPLVFSNFAADLDIAIRELKDISEADNAETDAIASDLQRQLASLREELAGAQAEQRALDEQLASRRQRELARGEQGLMGEVARGHQAKLQEAKRHHVEAQARPEVDVRKMGRLEPAWFGCCRLMPTLAVLVACLPLASFGRSACSLGRRRPSRRRPPSARLPP